MSSSGVNQDKAPPFHLRFAFAHLVDSFNSVAWSPDGKQIATGSFDRTVRVWEAESGKLLRTLQGHGDRVLRVAWSTDGKHLASGSDDNTVRVWEARSGKLVRRLEGHESFVWGLAWSPDDRQIVSGSHDRTVRVWDAQNGTLVRTLRGHEGKVWSVAWSQDGREIASGSADKTVRVWEAGSGNLARTLEGHLNEVNSAAWSPDGREIASGSDDNTVRLWEARTGKLLRALEGHERRVRAVAWSLDSKQVASGSDDRTVRVWEARSGKLLRTLKGHTNVVWSVAWSPDGKQIASGSDDKAVRLWEAMSGRLVTTLEGHGYSVNTVAWSPDGRQIGSGSGDNKVRVWEAGSGKLLATLEGHGRPVQSVAWSPDGKQIASGSDDGTVRVREAGSAKLVTTLEGHGYSVNTVAWSPDGRQIGSGSDDNKVRVWEAGSGKLLATLEGHESPVQSVAWSPDGKLIASGSDDKRVRVWESSTGQCLQEFDSRHKSHSFIGLAFRPATPIAPFFGRTRLGDPDVVAGIVDQGSAGSMAEGGMQIVDAKIVLVGESDVGKSGLALRLAEDRFEDQVSTHGMRLWPMPPEKLSPALASQEGEKREVVLWDLGGQDEYRLVHQLFLYDTTIALMLLDPTRDGHFDDIDEWNLRLEKRLRGHTAARLLVGAKADTINKDLIDKTRIDGLLTKWQMKSFCLTSAKENTGISELRDLIAQSIDWDDLSRTSRPRLFQRVREAVDGLRRKGEVVVLYSELDKQIKASEPGEFAPSAVNTVVEQLARQGAITDTRLSTGDRALILQVGFVEIYAGSLILIARENSRARGVPAIELSDAVFRRTFPGIKDGERLPALQERSVIECVVELMIENGICLKHERLLVFPTLFPETAAEEDEGAKRAVSLFYDFSGAVDNIYSALVAQLAVGERFGRVRLWRNRAEFDRPGQGVCGLRRIDRPGGWSHLDLLFGEETSKETRDLFTVFVEDHLRKEGVTIREVLEMDCSKCGYRFEESLVSEYISAGLAEIPCPRPLCDAVNPISEGAARSRAGSPSVTGEMVALRKRIDDRRRHEIDEAKRETKSAILAEAAPIRILHLSDLHLSKDADPVASLRPLVRDLRDHDGGLGFNSLDYLIVSGDLTNRASPEEFERVHELVSGLMGQFDLSPARCVIVPGNHDLSWEVEDNYKWQAERKVDAKSLMDGSYVRQGNGYLIRDDNAYPKRFENFNRFYHQLTQQPYPLKPEAQCMAFLFDEPRIQFLAMNSAWEIDEYFPHRSGINPSALANGLSRAARQLEAAKSEGRIGKDASILRIAVWHHPVTGNEKIVEDAFLDQLRQEEFKLCLHGHLHEDRADVIRYLHPRKIRVAGAGSFGARAKERPESTPRLYNVIEVWRDHSKVRVHTRCLKKEGGAWEGWAVWPGGKSKRKTYYDIRL